MRSCYFSFKTLPVAFHLTQNEILSLSKALHDPALLPYLTKLYPCPSQPQLPLVCHTDPSDFTLGQADPLFLQEAGEQDRLPHSFLLFVNVTLSQELL